MIPDLRINVVQPFVIYFFIKLPAVLHNDIADFMNLIVYRRYIYTYICSTLLMMVYSIYRRISTSVFRVSN